MSKKKNATVIGGITYYAPKTAGDIWDMPHQAVTTACEEGRIIGATTDLSGNWIVPSTAIKPLEKEQIKSILICILSIKNKPDTVPANLEEHNTLNVYRYLRDCNYIEAFDEKSERILYDVVITNKGMELLFQTPTIKINWLSIAETTVKCLELIVNIANLLSNNP